jgi:hypothetical protein
MDVDDRHGLALLVGDSFAAIKSGKGGSFDEEITPDTAL